MRVQPLTPEQQRALQQYRRQQQLQGYAIEPESGKKDKKGKKPKKPVTVKRVFAIIGIVLACLVVLGGIGLVVGVTWLDKALMGDKSEEEMLDIKESLASGDLDEPFYLLLIGSDERTGNASYGHRSDSVILMRVDPVKYVVSMISIPRDTEIKRGGSASQKFNAAYAFDGVKGAIAATKEVTGVEVSHFAEVNFEALISLVDAVGGVDINVGQRVDDWRAGDEVIEPGWQTINGKQALILSRARHYADGDFTRTAYQRTIIKAIVNKVLALPLGELPGVISKAAKCVSTDLKSSDLYSLALEFKDAPDVTFYSAGLPVYGLMIDNLSYQRASKPDVETMMQLVEAGQDPNGFTPKNGSVQTGTSVKIEAGEYDENGNVVNKQ